MDNSRVARIIFGATSTLVTFGIILQLQVAATNDEGFFEAVPARIINVLSYFTVQSNILVALTTGLLAARLPAPRPGSECCASPRSSRSPSPESCSTSR